MNLLLDGEFGKLPKPLQYIYNLGVLLSQAASTILGGDPDETVSSRIGKSVKSGCWISTKILAPFLGFIFREKDHALKSIEKDEGKKEVWSWNKSKKDDDHMGGLGGYAF